MLTKISGLARSIYIIVAIVAGFVSMGGLNVALGLVVLGLIAGISMPRDRMVLAAATIVALPMVGTALANIPAVGEQLAAVMANLQLGVAGAFAAAMFLFMYEMVMDGAAGVMGSASRTKATA